MNKKAVLYILFGLLVVFGLSRLYYRATDDFRLSNVSYELPHNPDWDIQKLNPEEWQKVDKILTQEFHYLGKGAQSYAFLSQDGKYVLKLIKFKHIKPSAIMLALPSIPPFDRYKEKHLERKNKVLTGVFSGYHLAYTTHKTESGILYIHLNRTNDINKTVTLYDKLGIRRKIDLDSVIFVLQHRVTKTREAMREALAAGDIPLAKKRMRLIFDLYFREYSKGIYDRDHGVLHNTGFMGDQPIHLDVGKLTRDDMIKDPAAQKEDFTKVTNKFDIWIKANYPDAYPELAEEIKKASSQIQENTI